MQRGWRAAAPGAEGSGVHRSWRGAAQGAEGHSVHIGWLAAAPGAGGPSVHTSWRAAAPCAEGLSYSKIEHLSSVRRQCSLVFPLTVCSTVSTLCMSLSS